MKNIYFIVAGSVTGLLFALFDTAISNAEVSAINPGIHDLLGNVSLLNLLVYMAIGATAGFLSHMLFLKLRSKHNVRTVKQDKTQKL